MPSGWAWALQLMQVAAAFTLHETVSIKMLPGMHYAYGMQQALQRLVPGVARLSDINLLTCLNTILEVRRHAWGSEDPVQKLLSVLGGYSE